MQISSLPDYPTDGGPVHGDPSESFSLVLRERRARATGAPAPVAVAPPCPLPGPHPPLREGSGSLAIDLYRRELAGKKCRRITRADAEEARLLIQKMIEFCRAQDGIGLAAPQVGVYAQLAVMRKTEESEEVKKRKSELGTFSPTHSFTASLLHSFTDFEVLVNPEIVNLGGRELLEYEGCLSLPCEQSPHGRGPVRGDPELPNPLNQAKVWRSEIAHVRHGTLEDPEAGRVSVYKGWPARIAQHEIDHLQGLFFIDRVKPVARGIVLRRYEKYLQSPQRRGPVAGDPDQQGLGTKGRRD